MAMDQNLWNCPMVWGINIHQLWPGWYHPGTSFLTHNYMNAHGISAATAASLQKGLPSPRWFPFPAASAGLAAWPERAGFPKSIDCGDWGSNEDLTTGNQQACEYLHSIVKMFKCELSSLPQVLLGGYIHRFARRFNWSFLAGYWARSLVPAA